MYTGLEALIVLTMKTALSFRYPPASASFLLGLHFDTEDVGDMACETSGFLQARCRYSPKVPTPHAYIGNVFIN